MRINSDGSPDTSFSSDGKTSTAIDGSSYASGNGITLQSDGKIVVVGDIVGVSGVDVALVRYNPDGSLDLTFSDDGVAMLPIRTDNLFSVNFALQSDGKILIPGSVWNHGQADFALARIKPDGSLDETFADNGIKILPISTFNDTAHGVVLRPDGRILVAGESYNGNNVNIAIACLEGDSFAAGFAAWMIAAGYTDPLGDYRETGITPLLTYLLGADLTAQPYHALPSAAIATFDIGSGPESFITIRYHVRNDAADASVEIECSGDLHTWEDATDQLESLSIVDNGDGTSIVTLRERVPIDPTAPGGRFYRVNGTVIE